MKLKIAAILISLAVLQWVSGFRVPPPPSLRSGTLFTPVPILSSLLTEDQEAKAIYEGQLCSRRGVWEAPALAAILAAHSALALGLLFWKRRP